MNVRRGGSEESLSTKQLNFVTEMAWVFSRYNYIRPDAVETVDSLIDSLLQRDLLRETFSDDFTCLGGEISPAH